jgi:hypothetical protein
MYAAHINHGCLLLAGSGASRPVKRRSEVDRRLEALVMKANGRLKEHNSANVIKVGLHDRGFTCDMG